MQQPIPIQLNVDNLIGTLELPFVLSATGWSAVLWYSVPLPFHSSSLLSASLPLTLDGEYYTNQIKSQQFRMTGYYTLTSAFISTPQRHTTTWIWLNLCGGGICTWCTNDVTRIKCVILNTMGPRHYFGCVSRKWPCQECSTNLASSSKASSVDRVSSQVAE